MEVAPKERFTSIVFNNWRIKVDTEELLAAASPTPPPPPATLRLSLSNVSLNAFAEETSLPLPNPPDLIEELLLAFRLFALDKSDEDDDLANETVLLLDGNSVATVSRI